MKRAKVVIGVDFDNTIADYDDLMHAIAVGRGLIDPGFASHKKLIRDAIRALPDGESHWRGLQVTAYGPRMREARLIEGVKEFFLESKRLGIPVYIVSHKTEYANFGEAKVNLRDAATAWLEQHGFFDDSQIGLSRERVFFESTREEKIARAKALGITHFVDDLEETFGEDSFPANVEKLLLAQHGQPTELSDAVSFPTWREIHERVLGRMNIQALARLAGSSARAVARVGSGGNSKVYRLDCADGKAYAAKFYFQRTMDGLDRLDVEFSSLEFLWKNGERSIPEPVAADREIQIALYEFVEGAPIDSRSASDRDIKQMISFAGRLKKYSTLNAASELPLAAEACFSVAALEDNIRGRLGRLKAASGNSASYAEFGSFVRDELEAALDSELENIQELVGVSELLNEIPQSARTLSPSDFGFHNSLRRPDGSVLVLDFEYFGWDDPAKLIADFVLHPAMELSEEVKETYIRGLLKVFASDAELPRRLGLMYPLFAIKWCAILLNEFVPDFLERREFAQDSADRENVRLRQLAKARKMLITAIHNPITNVR